MLGAAGVLVVWAIGDPPDLTGRLVGLILAAVLATYAIRRLRLASKAESN